MMLTVTKKYKKFLKVDNIKIKLLLLVLPNANICSNEDSSKQLNYYSN